MPETSKQPTSALPNREVRKLWFALRRMRPWRTLALVSADGAPVVALAHKFAQIASLVPKRHVLVLNAMPRAAGDIVRPPLGHYGVKGMRESMTESEILSTFVPEATTTLAADAALDVVLLAAPTPVTHAYTIPLIAAADATLLCVEIDKSRLGLTRETLQSLESEQLLGTVLIGGD